MTYQRKRKSALLVPSYKLDDAGIIRRAREILEMLRSRASEPELPRLERDYIDRLLRGLY